MIPGYNIVLRMCSLNEGMNKWQTRLVIPIGYLRKSILTGNSIRWPIVSDHKAIFLPKIWARAFFQFFFFFCVQILPPTASKNTAKEHKWRSPVILGCSQFLGWVPGAHEHPAHQLWPCRSNSFVPNTITSFSLSSKTIVPGLQCLFLSSECCILRKATS